MEESSVTAMQCKGLIQNNNTILTQPHNHKEDRDHVQSSVPAKHNPAHVLQK